MPPSRGAAAAPRAAAGVPRSRLGGTPHATSPVTGHRPVILVHDVTARLSVQFCRLQACTRFPHGWEGNEKCCSSTLHQRLICCSAGFYSVCTEQPSPLQCGLSPLLQRAPVRARHICVLPPTHQLFGDQDGAAVLQLHAEVLVHGLVQQHLQIVRVVLYGGISE